MTLPTLKESADAFDERLELSNITDLRRDLLKKVDEIHENPAIRLLILKHGRPQAVLLSAEAYDALKKVAQLYIKANEGLTREQIINDAISQFEAERSSVPAEDEEPAARVRVAAG
jgi:PHD/YefM family antitoxin component YafN of YafNO toxin-antitoxin module